MSPRRLPAAALSLVLASLASPAAAGPMDTRVGETRVLYDTKGTVLKTEPAATAPAAATLPSNTQVVVEEVKLPWVKVRAAAGAGWIKAYQAIEPAALAATPPPAHIEGTAEGSVSARDASAAGRQLTAKTERSFRAERADLESAYRWVDTIERETSAADPAESISFLMDGDLGRRGHDCLLPGRLPKEEIDADDDNEPEGDGGDSGGGGVGKALDGLGGLFGKAGGKAGKVGKILKKISPYAGAVTAYTDRIEKDFSPTQEYYLGRAVAANAIATDGIDPDVNRRRYVKRVGDAIVRLSNRLGPTVGGYHFDVLNTDEVNGISGPGGWVLVTRGAVNACRTEDELAGILCHELAHIQLKHGEQVVRKSGEFQRDMKAGAALMRAVAKKTDTRLGQGLMTVFKGAVTGMGRTAREHRYGRQFEFAADAEGANLLSDVYYDWMSLGRYLGRLIDDPHHGRAADAAHAPPAVRAQAVDAFAAQIGPVDIKPGILEFRRSRLESSLGRAPTPPSGPAPLPPAPPPPLPLPR